MRDEREQNQGRVTECHEASDQADAAPDPEAEAELEHTREEWAVSQPGETEKDSAYVTGTLVWYYYVCPRQVWLMGRHLTPDEEHPSIDLGRFIHEHSYEREKKELTVGHLKMDILKVVDGQLVIGEVKKSSRHTESARMQLLFYLDELSKLGINARGELRFPEERRREEVTLDDNARAELDRAKRDILRILYLDSPPPAKKGRFCKPCGYREFCWA